MKTIKFWPCVATLFNACLGPGLPSVPYTFSSSWLTTLLFYLVFSVFSGLTSILLVDAMKIIPGNQNFDGMVEYATMLNFYGNSTMHVIGQICLYGALISNSVLSIIQTAQSIDKIGEYLFSKSCAITLNGWICGSFPSDKVITVGYLIVLCLALPLLFSRLEDNIWVLFGSFIISIILIAQWMSSAGLNGLVGDRVHMIDNNVSGIGKSLGSILLNLGVASNVPSIVNIKSSRTNMAKVIIINCILCFFIYCGFGIIMSLGYETDENIFNVLAEFGKPQLLTKITCSLFGLIFLFPAIPVNMIMSWDNLVHNHLASRHFASFLCFVLPWLIALIFQGSFLVSFQTWTSLVFVGVANFIFPLIIFLLSCRFLTSYKGELNDRQDDLMDIIYSKEEYPEGFIFKRNDSVSSDHPLIEDADEKDLKIEKVVIQHFALKRLAAWILLFTTIAIVIINIVFTVIP